MHRREEKTPPSRDVPDALEEGGRLRAGRDRGGVVASTTYERRRVAHPGPERSPSDEEPLENNYSTFQDRDEVPSQRIAGETKTTTVGEYSRRRPAAGEEKNGKSPVKITTKEVVERRYPVEGETRYGGRVTSTTVERVQTRLARDLELRLISSFKSIIDVEKAVESSKQELALRPDYSLKDNFKMVDQQQKGFINFTEFSNFLKRIKLVVSKSNSVSKLFEEADSDGDGLINFVEFQDLISPKQKEYKVLLNCRVERGAGSSYDFEKV